MHDEHTYCLFQEPWWLDAVAPGTWRVVQIEEKGRVVARMPYLVESRYGLRISEMPMLTQTLGPWLKLPDDPLERVSEENRLLAALIDELPPLAGFMQRWHHTLTNWLPFYWAGFDATPLYTYVLDDLSDRDRLYANVRPSVQRQIKKARSSLEIRESDDIGEIWRLTEMTFARQGLKMPYSQDFLFRVDKACAARDARRILIAQDAQGRIHAGLFIVFDERTCYNLVPCADPALRNSGAQSLLLWAAIERACKLARSFDFEGSMMPAIEPVFRRFGSTQRMYLRVERRTPRARVAAAGRVIAERARGRALAWLERARRPPS